jgi:hypothetical protein
MPDKEKADPGELEYNQLLPDPWLLRVLDRWRARRRRERAD